MLICYLLTATVSLVGLMWDIRSGFGSLWYLHPLTIVFACIIAIQRRKRIIMTHEKRNKRFGSVFPLTVRYTVGSKGK